MNFDRMLEWVGKSPVNQLIVGGAAIVLLLLILFFARRLRRKPPTRLEASARLQAPKSDLREVFEGYRESHPAFYSVMSQIQSDRRLDDLMSNTEFAGAVAKLRLWQAVRIGVRPGKQPNVSPLGIQAGRSNANPEVRAAMITILRILYTSPEISRGLTAKTEEELDSLLESLTG